MTDVNRVANDREEEHNIATSPMQTTSQQQMYKERAQKSKQTRQCNAKKSDHDLCVEFYEHTCKCLKADGRPCSTLFPLHHYEEIQAQSYIMTHDELDFVLMGSLMITMHN